jgi:signal peptidase I
VARATDNVTIDDSGSLTVNGTTQTGEILYPTYPEVDSSLAYPYQVPENSVFFCSTIAQPLRSASMV